MSKDELGVAWVDRLAVWPTDKPDHLAVEFVIKEQSAAIGFDMATAQKVILDLLANARHGTDGTPPRMRRGEVQGTIAECDEIGFSILMEPSAAVLSFRVGEVTLCVSIPAAILDQTISNLSEAAKVLRSGSSQMQ